MNVAGFVRTVLARPLIILLVIVVTVGAGVVGWRSTTSRYETSGAVLVIPPGAGSHVPLDNPFVKLDQPVAQLAHVVVTAADSSEARERVAATGAQSDFSMAQMTGDSGSSTAQLSPQITFTITASDPWVARAGGMELIKVIRENLEKLQRDAGVVPGTMVDLRVVVEPGPGTEVKGSAPRAAVGYAMGAALGMILLLLLGTSAVQWSRRRSAPADRDVEDRASEESPTAGATAELPVEGRRAGEDKVQLAAEASRGSEPSDK